VKEITSVKVPGTIVNISIMKLVTGEWGVSRTYQQGLVDSSKRAFPKNERAEAGVWARTLWTETVNARNTMTALLDNATLTTFERAQKNEQYLIEMRLDV
jgi:hypothetical protein